MAFSNLWKRRADAAAATAGAAAAAQQFRVAARLVVFVACSAICVLCVVYYVSDTRCVVVIHLNPQKHRGDFLDVAAVNDSLSQPCLARFAFVRTVGLGCF